MNKLTLLTMLMFCIPARADEYVGILGSGNDSCSTYINASRGLQPGQREKIANKKNNRQYYSENASYDDWILGFVSALNSDKAAYHLSRPDIKVDNASVFASIRLWCETHPFDSVFDATIAFVGSQTAK